MAFWRCSVDLRKRRWQDAGNTTARSSSASSTSLACNCCLGVYEIALVPVLNLSSLDVGVSARPG
jgi:hypothetical protein